MNPRIEIPIETGERPALNLPCRDGRLYSARKGHRS